MVLQDWMENLSLWEKKCSHHFNHHLPPLPLILVSFIFSLYSVKSTFALTSATSTTHSQMLVNKRLNANPSLNLKIQQTKLKWNGSMHLNQWIGWRSMIMVVVMRREKES